MRTNGQLTFHLLFFNDVLKAHVFWAFLPNSTYVQIFNMPDKKTITIFDLKDFSQLHYSPERGLYLPDSFLEEDPQSRITSVSPTRKAQGSESPNGDIATGNRYEHHYGAAQEFSELWYLRLQGYAGRRIC